MLDISKLLAPESQEEIYPKEIFGDKIVSSIIKIYVDHIDFIRMLQNWVSFYDDKKELTAEVDINASYRL